MPPPTPTCCTCATILPSSPPLDPKTEKPLALPPPRTLPCCSRTICGTCQQSNLRFLTYCPFCQISTSPSSALPREGLRLPPSYTKTSVRKPDSDSPPSYDSATAQSPAYSTGPNHSSSPSSPPQDTDDVIHHLSADDTLASLSLAYHVPTDVLRRYNKIHSDNLLSARKWLLVPAAYYTGPPLSTPPDPDEEDRKNKLRRWMVTTKCADYDVAQLYLKASDYDLHAAIDAFTADERWEREHPLKLDDETGKGRNAARTSRRRRIGGLGLSGQLS